VKLTTHLYLVPWSKNAWNYTSTPQHTLMAWCSVKSSTRTTLSLTLIWAGLQRHAVCTQFNSHLSIKAMFEQRDGRTHTDRYDSIVQCFAFHFRILRIEVDRRTSIDVLHLFILLLCRKFNCSTSDRTGSDSYAHNCSLHYVIINNYIS